MKTAPILVLFFAVILGVRAWFASGTGAQHEDLHFAIRESVPGWEFIAEPVGRQAQEVLAASRLVNGAYQAGDGQRVTVFAAEWDADGSHPMSVVQHTPDVCWVGAGMKPIRLGQPQRITVSLGGREVPFECRVFGPPHGSVRELVVWCTLVGGSVVAETDRWALEEDLDVETRTRFEWAGRRLAAGQFLVNVAERRRGIGAKQFVRFSTPVAEGWEPALERLKAFAPTWLELEVRHRSSGGGTG